MFIFNQAPDAAPVYEYIVTNKQILSIKIRQS